MKILQRFQAMAPVLLEENASVFLDAVDRLEADSDDFINSDEAKRYNVEDQTYAGTEDRGFLMGLFLGIAQDLAYTLWIDWSGEEGQGEFETWVDARLHAFSDHFDYAVVDDWEETLDWDTLERGEYIESKFNRVGQYLNSKGFALIFFEDGGDAYYPFLLRQNAWASLPDTVRTVAEPCEFPYPRLRSHGEKFTDDENPV